MSVNLLNDYYDFKSGIDKHTRRTPFNGGSGMLSGGYVKADNVLKFALICFVGVLIIGAYFFMNFGPMILPIGLVGVVLICSYTQYLTKVAMGEFSAGLGFGLIVIGSYFTQTGVYDSRILLVSLIPSLLIGNLLLLNEFPDIGPDALIGKRKNTPVTFGTKTASLVYSSIIVMVYALLFLLILFQVLPIVTLLSLAIMPLAVKAISGVLQNHMCDDINLLLPYMRINVLVTILIPLLLSFSLIITKF
jgi:1,4-dihydroxy-2-naphthoate octaprenyltransferase